MKASDKTGDNIGNGTTLSTSLARHSSPYPISPVKKEFRQNNGGSDQGDKREDHPTIVTDPPIPSCKIVAKFSMSDALKNVSFS